MAKLDTKERDKLPKKDFALPGKIHTGKHGAKDTRGSYPIPDESHARDALARVSANGSPAQKKEVREKVHEKYPDIKISKKADQYGLIEQVLDVRELFGQNQH